MVSWKLLLVTETRCISKPVYLAKSVFWKTSALPVSRLQLLRIEEELGAAAVYAGAKFRAPVEPY